VNGLLQTAARSSTAGGDESNPIFSIALFFFRLFPGSQPLKEGEIDTSKGRSEDSYIDDQVGIMEHMHHCADLPPLNYFSTIL
jgi:hypothetical protein